MEKVVIVTAERFGEELYTALLEALHDLKGDIQRVGMIASTSKRCSETADSVR